MANGEVDALKGIWSQSPEATALHPIGGRVVGSERGSISLAGLPADIDQRVTNLYRKEAGTWKIVHPPTDVSPAMVEILDRILTKH